MINKITFNNCNNVEISCLSLTSKRKLNGKCLEFINNSQAKVNGCKLVCESRGTNQAPYPNKNETSAAVYIYNGSNVKIDNCEISGPTKEARGIIIDQNSFSEISNTTISQTENSGIWATNKSNVKLDGCSILNCGG